MLVVAIATEWPEAPEMWITVTADTLWPRSCEFSSPIGSMASLAREQIMRSTDANRSEVMVNRLIRFPPIERMTPRTVGASLTLVYIKVTALAALGKLTILVLNVAFSTALLTV